MTSTRLFPSINELRTFEAAARLHSVSAAAAELACSQPTATWRLRELERRWSVELFARNTRTLEWTDVTHRLYPRVRSLLQEIADISAEFENSDPGVLSVSVSPSFASAWLVDRLAAFAGLQPAIDLRLSATNRYVDLARESIDLAVRLLPRNAPPGERLESTPLLPDERLIIVCSPAYASRWPGPFALAALAEAQLLWHEETNHWRRFFATWLPDAQPRNGPRFNNVDLIIRSAIAHQGVAIVRELLASDALRLGHLIRPCPHSLASEDEYQLVYRQGAGESAKVTHFLGWLRHEIQTSVTEVRTD